MRSRIIRPSHFADPVLGAAPPLYGDLLLGLNCMADREGRLHDNPLEICAKVFPYRREVTPKKVHGMLDWLAERGYLVRYSRSEKRGPTDQKAVLKSRNFAADSFIQLINFASEQKPHQNEAPSKIQPLTPKLGAPKVVPGGAPDSGFRCTSTRVLTLNSYSSESPTVLSEEDLPPKTAPEPRKKAEVIRPEPGLDPARSSRLIAVYPKRAGRMNWAMALMHVARRLDEGEPWEVIFSGAERYGKYCDHVGDTGTQHVMDPATFFSAADTPWRQPWDLPKEKPSTRVAGVDISEHIKRLRGAKES